MPRRNQKPVDTDTDTDQLPQFDGTQLELGIWLRKLSNSLHLLPPELNYLGITGAYATKDHKTVVCSIKHGLLLQCGYIQTQNFSVTNPPPLDDGFSALYAKALADGISLPATPQDSDLPSNYPVSSDRIKAIDMQLLNELLSLITSSGRRMDYSRRASNSGFNLIQIFHSDKAKGLTPYAQSPYHQGIKLLLSDYSPMLCPRR